MARGGQRGCGTAKPDSHEYEYQPIREIAAGIERLIPPGQTINYQLGPLDIGTQPMEPAIRFLLVRHGDRVLANGSFPRLGSYYELYNRPVQWIVYLRDGTRPQPHMTLAARVRFTDPWGREVFSAWVRKAQPGRAARRLRASVSHRGITALSPRRRSSGIPSTRLPYVSGRSGSLELDMPPSSAALVRLYPDARR